MPWKFPRICRCLDGTAPSLQYLAAHCTSVSATVDCLKTSSSLCYQSSACCAVLPSEFIRTSGFLYRWPDDQSVFFLSDNSITLFTYNYRSEQIYYNSLQSYVRAIWIKTRKLQTWFWGDIIVLHIRYVSFYAMQFNAQWIWKLK